MDFGSGDGFGEGKIVVFHHDAADEGDEEHAEDAADEHEGGGFQVAVFDVEDRPGAGNDKGGDGEDGAGGDGLADGAGGTGEVLFENGSALEAEEGHADDGGGVGGGDRDAGLEPEIGIGGAEDDAHQETEDDGEVGELRHFAVDGDVGDVFFLAHC